MFDAMDIVDNLWCHGLRCLTVLVFDAMVEERSQ